MAFPARDYTESLVRPGPQPSVLIGRDWLALFKVVLKGRVAIPTLYQDYRLLYILRTLFA